MKSIIAICSILALSGCASTEYRQYAEAQTNIANARAAADQARYAALAAIAQQGDSAAKVAAVMSMMQIGGQPQQQQHIAAPKSTGETLLSWASLVLPSATQFYSISRQSAVAIRQSDNSAQVSIATSKDNATIQQAIVTGFVDVAGKVQGNSTSTTTNTTTTTTTTTPTQVIEKPVVVQVDKPLIVKPEVIQVDKPVIVNPIVIKPEVIQVPVPATPASGAGN